MKRLEDIPKSTPFTTPDGYFDRLPGIIQSRVAEKSKNPSSVFSWGFAFKYALPLLTLAGISLFWLTSRTFGKDETDLGQIQPEQLSFFLSDTDASTEEIIETVTWTTHDLDQLESNVYAHLNEIPNQEIESVMAEYDIEL